MKAEVEGAGVKLNPFLDKMITNLSLEEGNEDSMNVVEAKTSTEKTTSINRHKSKGMEYHTKIRIYDIGFYLIFDHG